MTGKEKIDALQAACRSLGLRAVRNNSAGWTVLDAERCKYTCWLDLPSVAHAASLRGLDEFLAVRYFEHYQFSGVFKIVENRFFGMSQEELALKLAVMGK